MPLTSRKTIQRVILILFFCLGVHSSVFAANSNMSGFWSINKTYPPKGPAQVETITNCASPTHTHTFSTTTNFSLITYTPIDISQSADGTISGFWSQPGSTSDVSTEVTGKVSGNSVTFKCITTIKGKVSVVSGHTLTVTENFTGTKTGKIINGTVVCSYYDEEKSSSGCVSEKTTYSCSGTFSADIIGGVQEVDTTLVPSVQENIATFAFAGTGGEGGIAGFYYQLDNNPKVYTTTNYVIFNNLSQGQHTFLVAAKDKAGNIDPTPATYTFKVSVVDTQITSGPAASSYARTAVFSYTGTSKNGIAGYYYQLDGAAKVYTTAVKVTFSNLSIAKHAFSVAAKDKEGNIDDTPAIWAFTVAEVPKPEPPKNNQNGPSPDQKKDPGDPVNVTTGNMYVYTSDFALPGKALPFDFTRTYNSRDDYAGPLGYGWTHSYNLFLTFDSVNKQVKLRDGQGKEYLFNDDENGGYVSQRGDYSKLTKDKTSYIWTLKNGIKYIFDIAGKLIKITDPNANTITLTYNKTGLLEKITDTAGRITKLAYDGSKRIISLTTPANKIYKYAYDANNNLVGMTDPKNGVIKYEYAAGNHNIVKKTDPNNNPVYFTHDPNDRCASVTRDNNYERLALTYEAGRTITTDSRNFQTTYYYNSDNLLTKIVYPDGSNEISTWDNRLNRTSHTDQLGRTSTMEYDAQGNLAKFTDCEGNPTTFTYEPAFNRLTSATDVLGNKTAYTYDAKGNLTKIIDPLGNPTSYLYNAAGQVTNAVNAYDKRIYYTYDAAGNLSSVKDLAGVTVKFTYDVSGNKITSVDPKNNSTQYAYDELNRLVKVTYPNKTTNLFTYDLMNNRLSATDGLGKTTNFTYDPAGKVKTQTDPLGNSIKYAYDSEGNLTQLTDQRNNPTRFEYDALNRLSTKTDALNYKWQYTYDAVGNRVKEIDSKGQSINYTYDRLNRLTQTSSPDTVIKYAYNAIGRQTGMADWQGSTYYTYDAAGRLLTVDGPAAKDTLTYTYDKVGNRLTMVDPDTKTTKYTYDAANRIVSIADPKGAVTKYTFDAAGNPATVVYPNKTTTIYTYDTLNRLSKITNQLSAKPNTKLSEFTYTYDLLNRKVKAVALDATYEYAYDVLGQLIQEKRTSKTNPYDIRFAYDPAGNRLSVNQNTSYSYNQLNQLTRENSPTGTVNYSYDNNGNLIKSGTKDYSYDSLNRLLKVTAPGVDEAYKYDGQSRRVELKNGSTATTYLYDGQSAVLERNSSGVTTVAYTRNPFAPGGIGGIISQTAGAKQDYYLYDGSGSVTNLASSAGVNTQTYAYDAFGNTIAQPGTAVNNHNFLTKEVSSTGLIYFGARYYDPRIGRFISADPSGMSDGPNLYIYCRNNPINLVDLWGLCGKKKNNNQYKPPWWERWFWEPSGERRQIWTWKMDYTLPPESVISAGWIGTVKVYWQNQSHYEQWGRWKWDLSGYKRVWNLQSGEKTSGPTEGFTMPSGPTHEIIIIAPEPNENPEP